MSQNPSFTILLIGPDAKLRAEFEAAMAGVRDTVPVTHHAADHRLGVEIARSRRPDLALVEMDRDLRALKNFADEIGAASPETAVVAVFHPTVFGPDVSESAVMIEAVRVGVRDFLRRPLSSADLEQLLERLFRKPAAGPARLGRVVSVASNKGGVGKSTLIVNLASGLAKRHPKRVLLIDASLQMGVCNTLLDLHPTTSLTDAARQRDRLDETLLRQLATPHPCGLDLLAAPANALEAAEVDEEVMARVLSLARRSYRYVLVDTFPMLDRVMVAVLDVSDRIYLIVEATVPTVLGMAHLLPLLDGLGLPRDRQVVVLNRYSNFAGNLRPSDVAQRLGRDVNYVVPYQKKLLIATNMGRPYIFQCGKVFSAFGRVLHGMVDDLESMEPMPAPRRASNSIAAAPSGNGTVIKEQQRDARTV